MDYTPKLSDQDVLERARDELNAKLPLEANGYICSGLDLWQILLGVSASQGTIHELCKSMSQAPSDSTVLGYLNEQLQVERLSEIEQALNEALASQIRRRVFKAPRDTAIDYHEQAYYQYITKSNKRVARSKMDNGTNAKQLLDEMGQEQGKTFEGEPKDVRT